MCTLHVLDHRSAMRNGVRCIMTRPCMPGQASLTVDSGAMRCPRIRPWVANCFWTLVEGTPGLSFDFSPCGEALHVQTAQRYALAAYQDGLTLDTIRDLASLASWGRLLG